MKYPIWANGRMLNLLRPTGSDVLAHFESRLGLDKNIPSQPNQIKFATVGAAIAAPLMEVFPRHVTL